jgi:lysophospholipase L1-like esterase
VTAGGPPECVGARGLQWQDEMARFRPDVVLVADAWQGFAPEDSRFAWLGDIGALGVAQQALELAIEPLVATGRPVAMVSAWTTVPSLGDRSFLGMDNVDRLNSVIVNAAAQRHDQVQVLEPPEVDRASPTSLAAWLGPRLRVIDAGGRGDAVHAMFVGDSVSMTMTPGFLRTSDPAALTVVDRSAVGCGLLRGVQLVEGTWQQTSAECGSWPERWAEDVAAYRPDVAVMQFGAWEVFDWQVDDEARTWGSAETNAFAMAEIEQAVQVLSSTGARVVLLTSPHFEARNVVSQTGEWRNRYDPARIDVWNDLLGQVAARHPDLVTVVDLYRFQSTYPDSEQLRVDGVHYTPEGADVVTEWLAPRLIAAAKTR